MSWEEVKKVLLSVLNVGIDLRDNANHLTQDTVRLIANDITSRIGNVVKEIEDDIQRQVVRT